MCIPFEMTASKVQPEHQCELDVITMATRCYPHIQSGIEEESRTNGEEGEEREVSYYLTMVSIFQ